MRTRAAAPINRDALAAALETQHLGLDSADKTLANIRALRDPHTFTVTTGHQLVLWGGPMFFVYKILSAIRLAEELQAQFPQHRFVPVYWMAGEDHDAEEINHYHPAFTNRVKYKGHFAGPVGRHVLEQDIASTFPPHLADAVRRFFVPGVRYAHAFRQFVHHLFGHYGLVILDSDDRALKQLFVPALTRELFTPFAHDAVGQVNVNLHAQGYAIQATAREINLFWMEDGLRQRIEKDQNGYFLVSNGEKMSRRFSEQELRDALKDAPEHFSPNVILRPAYQETILPNLAYIGGWGEFAYWMQLGSVFDALELPFPVLIPRMNASLLPAEDEALLAAQGLVMQDLTKPLHTLQEQIARKVWDFGPTETALARLQHEYDEVIDTLVTLDPTLARSFKGLQRENAHRGDHLIGKVRKSVRNRFPDAFRVAEGLRARWFAQSPQERTLGLYSFGSREERSLIQFLHGHCSPLQYTHQWITLP